MKLLHLLCVPENLDALSAGDADILVRHSSVVKEGKERFYLEKRIHKTTGKCV